MPARWLVAGQSGSRRIPGLDPAIKRVNGVLRLAALCTATTIGCRDQEPTLVRGTVEFTETDIAPLSPARVLRVLVEEGQHVRAGDTLVVMTQSAINPELETRRARVAAAEAEVRDLRAGSRTSEVERARTEVRAAQSEADRTRRDEERFRNLLASGSVSESQAEAAAATARVAAERLKAAQETLRLLELGARPERIRAAEAAVRQARAQVSAIEASASDLVLLAPRDGIVLGRHVEPGEVLAAGVPALSLGDAKRPWVRVYVSPAMLSTISDGDTAQVRVEGVADRTFRAHVVAIATRAEFTPRVALTEKERADLLFGVKLALEDSSETLQAGLPVTVTFADPARKPVR